MSDTFFDQIVFSGGGTRCMWQGGFVDVLRQEIPLSPERVTGVSGGACSACGFVTHRGRHVRDIFIESFQKHDRNIPLHEPFDGKYGYTPHQQIYREVIKACFDDPEATDDIAKGPQLEILIGRPPDDQWAKLTGAAMTLLYEADTAVRSNPHLRWPKAAGLKGEMIDARAAARDGRIIDLICAAATIPPAFEPPLWNGEPAIDAGMVDQAPFPTGDSGRTLVLLTKAFNDIPEVDGRVYVAPSEEVPADKIDFTDPQKMRDTWALGEEDARSFLRDIGNIARK
ncbi:Predicted acylesterase/phospholipase RssA, contains patatin domain [Palleronia marisminoris]|uniref:Patatin-like phospholipase n=1 Tax=Palleronia marisminoris TaxID=315423 RepID=A0A1Y5T1Y0_9RHOB|nr:patatin-like phospholipase family protein [Palleronia marisminoris]SFH13526.1 Predicted acylesterase/phospholipase RssA, contains patatin domain [Palleronia marisminoris]SLN53562.1 Patatin-like phospholipase [Palleronia marisminoris]